MPPLRPMTPPPATESETDERQMRRALGLSGDRTPAQSDRPEHSRPRSRNSQDAQVLVEIRKRRTNPDDASSLPGRLSALEAALAAERTAHASSLRALEEAQALVHALHTKVAHAEMSFAEALAVERRQRADLEAARDAAPLAEAEPHGPVPTAPEAQRRKRGRPALEKRLAGAAAQPVKWWLPGHLQKAKERPD